MKIEMRDLFLDYLLCKFHTELRISISRKSTVKMFVKISEKNKHILHTRYYINTPSYDTWCV